MCDGAYSRGLLRTWPSDTGFVWKGCAFGVMHMAGNLHSCKRTGISAVPRVFNIHWLVRGESKKTACMLALFSAIPNFCLFKILLIYPRIFFLSLFCHPIVRLCRNIS